MTSVTLPYNWTPRPYQEEFWQAMQAGCKRAVLVWHRRAGKDLTALNWMIMEMVVYRPGGSVWHVWPTYEQGRKFWEGADNTGRRYIDYIPKHLVKRKREDMMMIELVNGSIYRVVGSDEPDKLVGANPVGLIMTEYALQNPAAWDYLRPIISANNGTVIFPFTPRGHNHAYELYRLAKQTPSWYVSLRSVDDTKALPPSVLQEERDSGMSEELIQQEYYCSFSAPLSGAYYAEAMRLAQTQGRIGRFPYEPNLPVETWWDLGNNDFNAIWFAQRVGVETRLIDYMEGVHKDGMIGWIKEVLQKPYLYSQHVAPHDIAVREYSTGTSRWDTAKKHGITFTVGKKPGTPAVMVEHRDVVRRALSRCYFNEATCADGIEALRAFSRKYDSKLQRFADTPLKNFAIHGADAFRTGIVIARDPEQKKVARRPVAPYNPYADSTPYSRPRASNVITRLT